MKPIKFSPFNQFLTAHDPDIGVLPVLTSRYGDGTPEIISCWRLSLWERLVVLVTGRLFVHALGENRQPVKPSVDFAHIHEIEKWYEAQTEVGNASDRR